MKAAATALFGAGKPHCNFPLLSPLQQVYKPPSKASYNSQIGQ
jgi:hypothetical protein